MIENFIKKTMLTTLPEYHTPNTQEAIACLLSIALYGDYRMVLRSERYEIARTYDFHFRELKQPERIR